MASCSYLKQQLPRASGSICCLAVYNQPWIDGVYKRPSLDNDVYMSPPLDDKVHELLQLGIGIMDGQPRLNDHV